MPPADLRWRPTQAHLRAILLAGIGATAAVLFRRPDLLVLSVPFVVIAVWATLTRPRRAPRYSQALSQDTLREGERVTWDARIEPVPGMEEVSTALKPARFATLEPAQGQRSVSVPVDAARAADGSGDGSGDSAPRGSGTPLLRVGTRLRSMRWGVRSLGPGLVSAGSSWGAYRWGPVELPSMRLTTVPLPAVFDTTAPAPHPRGLVGLHRSARPGDGSEFASIRPFQTGDRLRRIHWSRSLRSGELHVTSSYADEDSHVALVVDAFYELGRGEGIEGGSSTLDLSVRAAGAVAEHFLTGGDRVSLRVIGDARSTRVAAAGGRRHLRRVLDSLASIEAGTDREPDARMLQLGLGAGALVVMMSPLVSPEALAQATLLSRRGLSVVVVDTMVDDAAPKPDGLIEFAWRIRMLERDAEIRKVQQAGVPVVTWRGPGSLDQVLRRLGRHGHASAGVLR